MALKAIIEKLDGLSEDIKKEYKQRDDGKYILDVTSVDGLELAEVSKLQSALAKERENNKKAQDKIKSFEQFEDLDPAKAREAIKKVEEMATWTPEQKVKEQIEAVKASMIDAHGKEKTKLQEKLTTLTKALEEAKIISVATQALASEKGSVRLLMPHIRQMTRMREADGKFVVEVLDGEGTPRVYGSDGHPMTINELVSEMKTQDDFTSAFEGTGATGSGASSTSTTKTKTGSHVISKVDAKDPHKYRAAKDAATKAGVQLEIAET